MLCLEVTAPMVIDVHAHYYPDRYLEAIGRPELPPPTALLHQLTIDERLSLLDRTGVDTQVLSVSQAQPYLPAAGAAAEAAKVGNDIYADLCAAHPGRFLVFAALPLPHVDLALDEITRAADISSVVGFTIGCSVNGHQLDDPIFEPLFAELDRRQSVILLHPVGQEDTPWLGPRLAWLVGATFEDTAAALRLVQSGMLDRYPGVTFIVPHLGGSIPFLAARLTNRGNPEILKRLNGLYYDTVCGSADSFASACKVFGADRLLFGTDYPFCSEPEFRRHLSYLGETGLDAADLAQVTGGTAARLLGAPQATA
jgi:aminocarboxymuconate-semialdehyde decarboxylase